MSKYVYWIHSVGYALARQQCGYISYLPESIYWGGHFRFYTRKINKFVTIVHVLEGHL